MSNQSASQSRQVTFALLLLVALGILVRVLLSSVSHGSDDAKIWYWFGKRIAADGLMKQYDNDPAYNVPAIPQFNHPPIPGYWAMIAYRLTSGSAYTKHQDARAGFPFVFRIPGILADVLSCWILYRIGRRRAGARAGALLTLAFAWSPCAIIIAGHHGSTDSIYAAFCLLAAYFAAELDAPLLAGLALGAAINVKLIPVFLILPMLALYRPWPAAGRFIAGLAIMAIPFVPVLIARGHDFFQYAMAYSSLKDFWGVNQFLLETVAIRHHHFALIGRPLMKFYDAAGRYLLAGCVGGFALVARWRRLDFYNAAAGSAAIFLILTPGFGMQYMIFVLPVLFAANFKSAMQYSLLAGAFLFIAYTLFWWGDFPIQTYGVAGQVHRGPGDLFGLLAWSILVVYVWRLVFSPRNANFLATDKRADEHRSTQIIQLY